MQITTVYVSNILVIRILGRLDGDQPEIFSAKMSHLLKTCDNIVLDLSDLEYMDSRGLGALISSLRKVVKRGGDIRIANVVPSVRMLMELTRADRVFQIFDTVEDGIKSFGVQY